VLFNLTYNLLPDYRYINENGVGKILHRVPFINRNSNYFNGYEYTALMTEISGLSITDTSDHQITMSGKVPTELEENSITFLPMNSDPNLDRPVQITKFDYPMLPPLMLNWQVYPIENTTVSVYDSSDKTIYTGNNTFVEDFLVDNFSLGKYKLIANNSLGSKMTELEVSAPDNQLIVSSVQMVKVDEFTEEEVREEVKDTLFFDNQDNTYILKINVINNPPLPLTFSPLGTNNAGTLIIEADPKEIIYPEYEEEYTVRISQISADDTDPIFTLTSGNITKEITLDLSSRMKSSKVVLTPDQMIALVGDDLEWRSLVENPNAENLILKQGLTLDDLNIIDENLKNEIQNEIEGEKALAETPDHSATTVAGSETTDLQTDDFETAGRVLGASTERILSKEEKTQSILYLGLLLLVITASFSSWFFVRKKMK
jgi:hypothetical protein